MSGTEAKLAQALTLYQQRRLPEAVALYREVLAAEPRNVDALHLCGLALAGLGDLERAAILLGAAAQLSPRSAAIHANFAAALSSAGRMEEALAAYAQALQADPRLPAALRGRATAAMQLGRHQAAVTGFREALQVAPNDDQSWNGLGVALERMGRGSEAREHFGRAVALNPANAEAHHNLGLLEAAGGRHTEALASIERALMLQPGHPTLQVNRGTQLLALRRPEEALHSFERALAIQPQDAVAHYNRGLALFALKRYSEALAAFDQALQPAPHDAPRLLWRGKALLELQRPGEALAAFELARNSAPGEFEVHMQCGRTLALLDRLDESLASFDSAIALNTSSPEAANNRGAILARLFRHEDAQAALLRARALRPQDANVRWSQALLSLSQGDFKTGLPLYEARLELPPADRLQHPDIRRWDGAEPLAGRTLYVYADQGLGDTLQFCRYIPVLEELGARVIFAVQPVLVRLLQSLQIRGQLIARGASVPAAHLCIPLASVPLALGTELATIPAAVPYLHADPQDAHAWARRLGALPGLKVGLNWHGNPAAEKLSALQARSFPLACAAPLAAVAGVSLVSLQKGDGAEQRDAVSFARDVALLTEPSYMGAEELASETAPLLAALDLVITADTALAHLAGALGIPVWVVLQQIPDWRWLRERSDSPWYPSMRLFRQHSAGDWDELFGRVATQLAAHAAAKSRA